MPGEKTMRYILNSFFIYLLFLSCSDTGTEPDSQNDKEIIPTSIDTIYVGSAYQFFSGNPVIQLGGAIVWLPNDPPTITHTITSTNIPNGADSFDQIWKLPADTFFQYIPNVTGEYQYECTPHTPYMSGSFTVIDSLNE